MKTLSNILGAIVICMVLLLVTLRFTGLNPHGDTPGPGSYPGLWLSGNLVTTPVADWSFTDNIRNREASDQHLVSDSPLGNNLVYRL